MFTEQNNNKFEHVTPDLYDAIRTAFASLETPQPCYYCGAIVTHKWFPVTGDQVAHQICAKQAVSAENLN